MSDNYVDFVETERDLLSLEPSADSEKSVSVLIVGTLDFFAKRDEEGLATAELSTVVRDCVLEKFDHCYILSSGHSSASIIKNRFSSFDQWFPASKFKMLWSVPNSVTETNRLVMETLIALGASFRVRHTDRKVNWTNIDKYMHKGPVSVVVGLSDSHDELGIPVDKELSFAELAQKRELDSWI